MNRAPTPIHRIPVIVLTGFLGSGKTTLLNSILTQAPRSAVIINEFGATPIDQQLLRKHNILVSTLSGGCLCCQVRDALGPVLKNLRMTWESKTEKPFDRIIIETSGVANPGPILDVLLGQNWINSRYNLQAIIATVPALAGSDALTRFPDAQAQIAWADTIAITHTDLASSDQIQALESRLTALSAKTNKVHVINGVIELGRLLTLPTIYRSLSTGNFADVSDHGFNSITLQWEQPLASERLILILRQLMEKYGDRLVRLKGLVFDPVYDRPLLIQGSIGILYPPVHLPGCASDDFISRLVLIMDGAVDGLVEELQHQLRFSSA